MLLELVAIILFEVLNNNVILMHVFISSYELRTKTTKVDHFQNRENTIFYRLNQSGDIFKNILSSCNICFYTFYFFISIFSLIFISKYEPRTITIKEDEFHDRDNIILYSYK
jgi:hypothetical protein